MRFTFYDVGEMKSADFFTFTATYTFGGIDFESDSTVLAEFTCTGCTTHTEVFDGPTKAA